MSPDLVHDGAPASPPAAHGAPAGVQHAQAANCHNCGAPAPGQFCAQCGQGTTLHVPSAREFLHEFVGHYVALEGKLWGTLMRLLFRPGALTNEYIAGRRVRYVEPLRVYLTFSILFFFLIKLPGLPGLGGHEREHVDDSVTAQIAQGKQGARQAKETAQSPKRASPADAQAGASEAKTAPGQAQAEVAEEQAGAAAAAAGAGAAAAGASEAAESAALAAAAPQAESEKKSGPPTTAEQRAMRDKYFLRYFDSQPLVRLRVQHVLDMPQEEQTKLATEAFFHYAPYAMFCLLPVFALYLKVLYLGSGRLYGEHFLFALHANAFAFLMFALIALVPWGFVQFVLVLWLLGYLPWAMRRVYRSGKLSTTVRWLVLIGMHFLTIVSTLFSVVATALLV